MMVLASKRSRLTQTWLFFIAGLTFASYYGGLYGPFLFDDYTSIVNNPFLRFDPLSINQWREAALSFDGSVLGRPVAMLTFALDSAISGSPSAITTKFGNLLLHLGAGVLVFELARLISVAVGVGWASCWQCAWFPRLAAAMWLLHPLHVSTVLYPVQRMAQLSTIFVLLGLVVFFRYRLRWAQFGFERGGDLAGSVLWILLFTCLAVFSKENGILLLWLIPLAELAFFSGQWSGKRSRCITALGWLALLCPVLLLITFYLWIPDWFHGQYEGRNFSLGERLMTQARLLWQYLTWIALPNIYSMGMHHDDIELSAGLLTPVTTLLSISGLVVLLALAILLRKKHSIFAFSALFFLIAHSMESSFLALEIIYEHRNYLPSVSVCIFLAYIITALGDRYYSSAPRRLVLFAPIIVLAALLGIRSFIWSDELLMGQSHVSNHPESPRSRFFYALALQREYFKLANTGSQDPELLKAVAVASRAELEEMQRLSPGDFAAPVMLQFIDSTMFPGLSDDGSYIEAIEGVLSDRVLQASDYAAISHLVTCVVENYCSQEISRRVLHLLVRMVELMPGDHKLLFELYRFYAATDFDASERIELLRTLAASHPNIYSHYYLLELSRRGDLSSMYGVVGNWIDNDPERRFLTRILELFAAK